MALFPTILISQFFIFLKISQGYQANIFDDLSSILILIQIKQLPSNLKDEFID